MESTVNFDPYKVLFKEDEIATKLYMIKSGEVVCLKAANDRLIPVFVAKENDIIGESAMMKDFINTYSAISLTSVEVIEIPALNFRRVMETSPQWIVDLTATMISRFQNTAHLIAENRVISPLIMDDGKFTPAQEIEFKKMLNQ
jgi:CRP-like cAMP-binding protein